MRRNIVHIGADSLTYAIRGIVSVAKKMEKMGAKIVWENIGDPVEKGEKVADWIIEAAHEALDNPRSWAYCHSQGQEDTRQVLADFVNQRGGVQISSEDILFFNGLGDAISKIFGEIRREARIIGPSPAYSTHSSAEAAHSGYEHLTYALDPKNNWLPDVQEIRNKIKYNDTIAGILLISPNNPTGASYPRELLEEIVEVAREYRLMVINDEIYSHIVYGGAETVHLSEVLGDVPGLALRGISKELPWPGSRCGWIEMLNRGKDEVFDRYVKSLIDSKMLEVCSTSLPQLLIPKIYKDDRFPGHLQQRAKMFEKRGDEFVEALSGVEGIHVVRPQGAFYMTLVFEDGVLNDEQHLEPLNEEIGEYLKTLLYPRMPEDQRFTYHLMAATGLCVVPLSGFCCERRGFRITLLETDPVVRQWLLETLKESIAKYIHSA